ncbi:MAG: penicillin acylase family protein, partial [Deltaproteobacteria bacterium]|nr:penicillin acylase family protein [Deltaproteobacteria bacterium]
LAPPETWQGEQSGALRAALARVAREAPRPWGEVQTCTARHLVLGGVGLGFDRGPFELLGSRATVRQGNLLRCDGATLAVGPAYRLVTDLGDDAAWTSLPGGIDGSRFDASYACWLDEWRRGAYHRIAPPDPAELELT